jgi:hypothetical protein
MSPLAFVLLLGLTSPQDQPASAQQNSGQSSAPQLTRSWQIEDDALRHAAQQTLRQRIVDGGPMQRIVDGAPTCYAIRSYVFKRQDGNAPVLVGTTTCTPSDKLRTQEVAHPPKVKLVPLI